MLGHTVTLVLKVFYCSEGQVIKFLRIFNFFKKLTIYTMFLNWNYELFVIFYFWEVELCYFLINQQALSNTLVKLV